MASVLILTSAKILPTGAHIEEFQLLPQVQAAIQSNPQIKSDNKIVVREIVPGQITLGGNVGTAQEKTAAAQVAANVPGVREVINHIQIESSLRS